jgi:Cof subfamily protein (haloacid dehalogenase superfamily)
MIKIIGLDLDGTLLNDQKAICDRNIEVLMRAKEEGAKIVLCSGRAPEGMQRELKILGLKEKGQYAVGLNGAVVYEADTGKVIHQTLMQPEAVRTMVETGRRFRDRMNIQLYTSGQVYVERWDETTDYYEKATGSHPKLVDDVLEFVNETIKIVFFHKGEFDYTLEKITKLKNDCLPSVPQGTQCVISAPYLVEFLDESIDKGIGMDILAKYLNVPQADVMCVGDQENDMPMLKYAGLSVVMANGAPHVKELAHYVTEIDNNEGGVAEAVEKFVLKTL